MAHYRKHTKKSSYTQTLHLKPFAAGFSRKNWKRNLLTESRLCFENRLAELSLRNLGSRSQFTAGGTVRDAGITEWQHSRGRQYSAMTCCHFSQGLCPAHPSLAWGSEQVFWARSRSVPAQGSARRNTQALPQLRLLKPLDPGSKGHLSALPCLQDLERGGDIRKNGATGKGAEKQLWPEDKIVNSISSLLHVLPKQWNEGGIGTSKKSELCHHHIPEILKAIWKKPPGRLNQQAITKIIMGENVPQEAENTKSSDGWNNQNHTLAFFSSTQELSTAYEIFF